MSTDRPILVVDRHPGHRESLRALLASAGYRADSATDELQTLGWLARSPAGVIVLDWSVDVEQGHSLLGRLRRDYPDCPVLVISGDPDTSIGPAALRLGARRFLPKPLDTDRFIATIAAEQRRFGADAPGSAGAASHWLGQVFDDGPEPVLVAEADGRLQFANRAARSLLGGAAGSETDRLDRLLCETDWQALCAAADRLAAETGAWLQVTGYLRGRQCLGDAGERRLLRLRRIAWPTPAGERPAILLTASTPPAEARAERELCDSLTGLPNRALLDDRLRHSIRQAQRRGNAIAVMFIDLDRFKSINDTLGHRLGDRLLRAAAGRIHQAVRASDTLARYGGDEFVLLFDPVRDGAAVDAVAAKIVAAMNQPFRIDDHELHISASIGVALFPRDGDSAEMLVDRADMAMYAAKQQGKNGFRHFDPSLPGRLDSRVSVGDGLREALSRGEFVLHYQPLFRLAGRRLEGFEALLRWDHPQRGLIAPASFIGQAESLGLMGELGDWVWRTVFEHLRAWRRAGLNPTRVAVNLSAAEIENPDLPERLDRLMAEFEVDGAELAVDIAESVLDEDSVHTLANLRALSARRIRIVVDDFGRGRSRLGRLHTLPIDAIKLDHGFLAAGGEEPGQGSLISAIGALAGRLGLSLAAEGVETGDALLRLGEAGAESAQGRFLGPVLPFEQASELLRLRPG